MLWVDVLRDPAYLGLKEVNELSAPDWFRSSGLEVMASRDISLNLGLELFWFVWSTVSIPVCQPRLYIH